MSGLALATASAVLKDDYKDLRELLNQNFGILSQVEKNTEDVEGLRAVHAVHVSRNSGVGARGDGGTLPTAGNQGYVAVPVPVRYNYGRIQISGPTIKAMKSNKGSFVRAVKSEMDGITNDIKRDINRQTWGTSDGVIATCAVSTTTVTINLNAATTPTQFRQLWADGGMVVDIGTVASPTLKASARAVTGYSVSGLTITIAGATITTATTDRVFRAGSGGATTNSGLPGDGQYELTGLQSIVSATGTLHAVNPSTYPIWAAQSYGNSGSNRSISDVLVNTAIMDTETVSGEHTDLLVGSGGISRAAAALMTAQRRTLDKVDLKNGYSGLAWSTPMEGMGKGSTETALFWEKDCPENKMFGLSSDSLVEYVESDWEWMDEDGAVLSRVSGVDAYEAVYFKYHELACKARNANFVISDLTAA